MFQRLSSRVVYGAALERKQRFTHGLGNLKNMIKWDNFVPKRGREPIRRLRIFR